jgi:hypothetical protein
MPVLFTGFRQQDQRLGTILRPASAFDEEKLRTAGYGQALEVSVTWPEPRSLRWYRGLVRRLVHAGAYQNDDEGHFDLMIRTRRAKSMVLIEKPGVEIQTRFEPLSTSGWDGPQWRGFLADVVEVVVRDVVPKLPIGQLRAEVERFVGLRLKDALAEEESRRG